MWINYTPENDPVNGQPNGANPCWVILNFSNNKTVRLHHTFNVKHPSTYNWSVNFAEIIARHGLKFIAHALDPGADDLTFQWCFGDGTNFTHNYTNTNRTFPVEVIDTVVYGYISDDKFTLTLIVMDDDGGVTIINYEIIFT
jgi:hypothetical protein